jgi:arsenical pump membrane protein
MAVDGSAVTAWGIAGLATAGVIARPFGLPEAIWAVAGAVLLVAIGLLPWADAWSGIRKGLDVYFFLAGMMLIAEVARQEGGPGPRHHRAWRAVTGRSQVFSQPGCRHP